MTTPADLLNKLQAQRAINASRTQGHHIPTALPDHSLTSGTPPHRTPSGEVSWETPELLHPGEGFLPPSATPLREVAGASAEAESYWRRMYETSQRDNAALRAQLGQMQNQIGGMTQQMQQLTNFLMEQQNRPADAHAQQQRPAHLPPLPVPGRITEAGRELLAEVAGQDMQVAQGLREALSFMRYDAGADPRLKEYTDPRRLGNSPEPSELTWTGSPMSKALAESIDIGEVNPSSLAFNPNESAQPVSVRSPSLQHAERAPAPFLGSQQTQGFGKMTPPSAGGAMTESRGAPLGGAVSSREIAESTGPLTEAPPSLLQVDRALPPWVQEQPRTAPPMFQMAPPKAPKPDSE